MIAEFTAMLDLNECRRTRWSDKTELAERIHFRRLHRWYERAMHGRQG